MIRLSNLGNKNRNGNKLAKSTVERMFKNIFYIGQFEFKGFICTNAEQINKRIKQAYEDKCDGTIDEDLWREINKSYHDEKTELIEAMHRVNEADVRFYETCEKLLKFARNAHQMFLNGSVEDKRFITQTVLSNSSYYDGNFDVELHPAFDTLFRLSQASEHQNSTIELAETQAGIKKSLLMRL